MATVDEAAETHSAPGRLSGKVALVTGAGQGLGQAFAERLARDGASLVVVAHRNAPTETVRLVEATGSEHLVHHADVSAAVVELAHRIERGELEPRPESYDLLAELASRP